MGYMGLDKWSDSDMASGAFGCAVDAMLKVLSRELKSKENCYNTDGVVNVALVIESGLLDVVPDYYLDEFNFKYLLDGLEQHRKEALASQKDQWQDEESRKMHLNAYERMIRNVKKFLKSKNIDIT
jgi:hypothetical protein